VQLVHEDLDRLASLLVGVLSYRAEAEKLGELVVVDAHDRHVLRNAQPHVAGCEHRADRHLV
jgi:hypothetical protein